MLQDWPKKCPHKYSRQHFKLLSIYRVIFPIYDDMQYAWNVIYILFESWLFSIEVFLLSNLVIFALETMWRILSELNTFQNTKWRYLPHFGSDKKFKCTVRNLTRPFANERSLLNDKNTHFKGKHNEYNFLVMEANVVVIKLRFSHI